MVFYNLDRLNPDILVDIILSNKFVKGEMIVDKSFIYNMHIEPS